MLQAALPNGFRLRMLPRSVPAVFRQTGEIFYIGGTDVLPAPLEGQEEADAIAGLVITYVLCVELISMVTEKNNMHDIDTFMFFKWFFKAFVAVYLVTHTFDITMAVFDMAQHVVSGAAGVIGGSTEIDVAAALGSMQDGLDSMEIPELLLLVMETSLVSLCMKIMSVLITVILYGRMIEIYRASRSAAFHPKAVCGHFGNPALASR